MLKHLEHKDIRTETLFISIKLSYLLVPRYVICVALFANLWSILKKCVMNSIEEFPLPRCSTVYLKKKKKYVGGGGATEIMKWILVV